VRRLTRWATVVLAPFAVAALALAGTGASASAVVIPPHAITNGTFSCGDICINVSSQEYGTSYVVNGANTGKVTLRQASDAYPNEDLVLNGYFTVRALVKAGIINPASYVALTYPHHYAAEFGFSPYGSGVTSCIGVAVNATAGEGVTKQACGASDGRTFWVFDPKNNSTGLDCLNALTYCPVINASDTNLTTPEVLTATGPTSKLVVDPERKFSTGNVEDQQMFEYTVGVTP
jgi:hypothetical protein